MVRWAAELLSKYSCGDDGLSPHERLHGEKCLAPPVPSGEAALYLQMETVRRDKGDTAKKFGVWLGAIARTQEVLIGTAHGVIKCKAVSRLVDDERWDAQRVFNMKGTPWEPVPGNIDRRVPVAIDSEGNGVQLHDDDDEGEQVHEGEDEETPMQFREGNDKFHVSRKAIEKYGPTDGCPACTSIIMTGMTKGRVGVNHNDTCRKRVLSEMRSDPAYRQLMQKHESKLAVIHNNNSMKEDNVQSVVQRYVVMESMKEHD